MVGRGVGIHLEEGRYEHNTWEFGKMGHCRLNMVSIVTEFYILLSLSDVERWESTRFIHPLPSSSLVPKASETTNLL